MKKVLRSKLSLSAVFAGASAVSAGAFADAATAVTDITAVGGDIELIGWAVLGVLVVAAGFKYMRRAI